MAGQPDPHPTPGSNSVAANPVNDSPSGGTRAIPACAVFDACSTKRWGLEMGPPMTTPKRVIEMDQARPGDSRESRID